jgi:hypothetical protein
MKTDMLKSSTLPITAAATLALHVACFDSSSPSEIKARQEKGAKKAAEPVSGQNAYYRMYGLAKGWAPDVQAYQCEPVRMNALPEKDGRFPAWKCSFVSESKRQMKTYSYSVIEGEGLYKDVFAGHDESYSGPRGQNVPFPILALKIDTDAAIETAKGKSAEYMKKNPDLPITPVLEKTKELGNAVWRVYWGNPATSNYSVLVDASTGEYIKTMR